MAIKFNFDGKSVIEPGSYAKIVGGSSPIPPSASFGKVLLIDTGKGLAYGVGGGINGELSNGKNSVYEFTDITEFKKHIRGGLYYDLADYLFKPSTGGQGVDSIKLVKAATTTAASISYTLSGSSFITKTGTITSADDSTTVTGVNTLFESELNIGDTIAIDATDTPIGVIESIESDTSLTLTANAASANSAIAFSIQKAQPQGGAFTIKTKNEGLGANGIISDSKLIKGYGARLESGILNTNKYRLVFYVGGFKGVNETHPNFSIPTWSSETEYAAGEKVVYNGVVWNSLQGTNEDKNPVSQSAYWELFQYADNYGDETPAQSVVQTLVGSPEFSNLNELINWMTDNPTFNTYFKLTASTVNGDGIIDDADLVANATMKAASGATTTYSSTDFDTVLDNIAEEDNSFILSDEWGASAKSSINDKIVSHINTDAEFKKILVIGGGYDKEYFSGSNGSIGIAQYFNSARVCVVHSGISKAKYGGGEKNLPSIYHAALYLGRTAGLDPQVPTTWKDINILKPQHELSKKERELALMAGVIHTKFVDGKGWVINQSINTLQRNDVLFLPDGDSYEVSIERIKNQLNKEIILGSRITFVGGNLATSSAESVKLYVEGYLESKKVVNGIDNLIITSRDVSVKLVGDSWEIRYGFVANSPINKLFITGTMLDANINI